jgi:uncharacterized protein (TIGR02594 family)
MTAVMTKLPDLPWVRELQAVHGLHEVRDRAKLAAWLKSDGKTLGDPSKLPWCGDAIDTAIARALPNEARPDDLGKNPYWALNWLFLGVKTSPVYGAIGAFKRPGGGHVGILMAQDKGAYLVLGGNQGDTVSRVWISKDRLVEARWPSTFRNPRVPLPWGGVKGQLSENEA